GPADEPGRRATEVAEEDVARGIDVGRVEVRRQRLKGQGPSVRREARPEGVRIRLRPAEPGRAADPRGGTRQYVADVGVGVLVEVCRVEVRGAATEGDVAAVWRDRTDDR